MESNNKSVISTVGEFINEVKKISIELSDNSDENLFWFRGEADNDFENPLTPGSYRLLASSFQSKDEGLTLYSKLIHDIERQVDTEFFRKGRQYLKDLKVKNNLLNRYFIMQHYGIPTRLLDWSENALVALFFSAYSKENVKDGVVYILEPYELNNSTVQNIINTNKEFKKIPTIVNDMNNKTLVNDNGVFSVNELYKKYLKMDFSNKINEDEISFYPLAITPPPLERRMLIQSGCFTIFGNEIKGLVFNNKKDCFLRKIVVHKNSKKSILKELDQLGINENSIFSDLDSLGSYLKRKYSPRYQNNYDLFDKFYKSNIDE